MNAKISKLASQCLRTESLSLARQQAILQSLHVDASPPFSVHRSQTSSALTILTNPTWTGKLNHTVCFGITLDPVAHGVKTDYHKELTVLERVYGDVGLSPELHMCELSEPQAIETLLQNGYTIEREIETFCKIFHPNGTDTIVGEERSNEVSVEETEDGELFVRLSVQGFLSGGRAPELLSELARCAAIRSDSNLFVARIDGQIVGCAATTIVDIEEGVKAAYMGTDSTLPASRGKGVHVALLKHRVKFAREAGCHLVVCAARKGSGSARNIQRAGLSLVYNSGVYTKQKK